MELGGYFGRAVLAILALGSLLWAPAFAQENTPNDPRFPEQWALMQVNALCAWRYTQGEGQVTVAVVDSGVDPSHPDLQGRLRGDGYDFVDDDAEPRDENGHGTNVAGVVAAVANNGEGIAGLAPEVQILPVRVMDAQGYGDEQKIADGIRYAADKGARVINLSLGASLYLASGHESAIVGGAISDAQAAGALVVAAAGNDFVPAPNIVGANNADVLVVAASDQQDRKAPFSNFGPWVGVTAPGVSILSTMPTYEVYLTSLALPETQRFRQGYDFMSGTSQAAPFVSALAALLFVLHPEWAAREVGDAIKASAVDIDELNPELAQGRQLGAGRIDACRALGGATQAQAVPQAPVAAAPLLFERPLLLAVLGATLAALTLVLVWLPRIRRRPAAQATQPPPATAPARARVLPQPETVRPAALHPGSIWGRLIVVAGPSPVRECPLYGATITLGRNADCNLVLDKDQAISRRHLRLMLAGDRVLVEDLGSTHGTYLNGQRLQSLAALQDGDLLQVGQTRLRFTLEAEGRRQKAGV